MAQRRALLHQLSTTRLSTLRSSSHKCQPTKSRDYRRCLGNLWSSLKWMADIPFQSTLTWWRSRISCSQCRSLLPKGLYRPSIIYFILPTLSAAVGRSLHCFVSCIPCRQQVHFRKRASQHARFFHDAAALPVCHLRQFGQGGLHELAVRCLVALFVSRFSLG